MSINRLIEQLNTDIYKGLLKKYFNFNIVDNININEEESNLFNSYINKKITNKSKQYDFEIHDVALTLANTKFVYEIEGFLIGVCVTPNNKEFIVAYKLNEYYTHSIGNTLSNWITNLPSGESSESIRGFMNECNEIFSTSMELYDPGEDESDWGFDYN